MRKLQHVTWVTNWDEDANVLLADDTNDSGEEEEENCAVSNPTSISISTAQDYIEKLKEIALTHADAALFLLLIGSESRVTDISFSKRNKQAQSQIRDFFTLFNEWTNLLDHCIDRQKGIYVYVLLK